MNPILTAEVTLDLIQQGKSGHGSKCPVALALSVAIPHKKVVVEHEKTSLFSDPNSTEVLRHDPLVQKWTQDFDVGRPVEPFVLKIDPKAKLISHAGPVPIP